MDWINTNNCFALIIVNFSNIMTSHYTNQALYKWERFHNWIGLQTVSANLIKIVYHVDYKTNYTWKHANRLCYALKQFKTPAIF